ncbi:MAG: type II secretion system F family protein [Phycisphaerae bacterium]|nr:type II secretion system F family protein [Phycisphaerae bacterium]
MATYLYEAMNAAGQEVKAEIEAASTEEAISRIREQGLFPTKVKAKAGKKKTGSAEVAKAGKRPAGAGGFGKVSSKRLTQFTRQLATLQDAGLPILRSLRILEQQQKPGLLRNVIQEVGEDVEGGATLSEAMAKHPKAFDRLYTKMVAAGEAGGVLETILERLAEFMEKAQRLKRKVVGAMVYPAAVLTFAGGIVLFIMIFVVPKFEQIFRDFGTTLPGPTQALINISNWLVKGTPPGWLVIISLPFIVMMALKLIKMSETGRYFLDMIIMKIPILGSITQKNSVARFTRTLGTLINAGVPILEAINITKDTTGNEVFSRALVGVHDSIREGESFAEPLRASRVADSLVVNMVDVGEETGELDKMLMKVADNYDEEVETMVGSLVSLLEPVLVIFLGLIVGSIVVALFLPMVKLIGSVTGGAN